MTFSSSKRSESCERPEKNKSGLVSKKNVKTSQSMTAFDGLTAAITKLTERLDFVETTIFGWTLPIEHGLTIQPPQLDFGSPIATGHQRSLRHFMARQTRRGMQFSPYELDASHRQRDVGLIETTAIDDLIEGALAIADRHFQDLEDGNIADEEDDEWEDAFEVISLAPSPLSSAASSPLSSPPRSRPGSPSASVSSKLRQASPDSCKSRSGSPLSDSCPTTPMPIDPADDPDLTPLVHNVHRRWRLEKAVARRRKRRRRAAPHTPFERRPNLHRSQVHREQPPETLNIDAGDLPVSSGGAWTGKRSKEKRRLFNLPELRAMKCKVIQWNGRPKLILDARGRIVAILIGRPEDVDWDTVVDEAVREIHHARKKGVRLRVFKPARPSHRRGQFSVFAAGVSFGGGQKSRCTLSSAKAPEKQEYPSARWFPIEFEPGLIHNFSNSIFPTVTFNCGPDMVTFDHRVSLNLANGLCGITCGGDFDHSVGGHIYLKQLKFVIEFPSGSSILIPSGCVNHGNTPLQPGETRTSMTQYAAGGLFRWVAYGFQSAKSLLSQEGGKEMRDQFDGALGLRWEQALDMFSKYDELEADQKAVFQGLM
ncbi:hypothetical protein B0H10DRAFT_2392114 [Mycena sp. CBHHK59/15]|nr:hypothetical protein B0H10DRAFT_2392114 [Mycena sp. CBHHK59/15]